MKSDHKKLFLSMYMADIPYEETKFFSNSPPSITEEKASPTLISICI